MTRSGARWIRGVGGRMHALVAPKIFCLSMHRTGTTSVGQFYKDHGYRVADWHHSHRRRWTHKWFAGDFEGIFSDLHFLTFQVFQDDPWFSGTFYKVLYHRFPNARFVLLERDPDAWYASMQRHSDGRTLGNTYRHVETYRREADLRPLPSSVDPYGGELDHLLTLGEAERAHYIAFYVERNQRVREFFTAHDPDRLFYARLEDNDLWQCLGRWMSIEVATGYKAHRNPTARTRAPR